MSLSEQYHNETGLHSHYKRKISETNKFELSYTRKYVWWLEIKIQEFQKKEQNEWIIKYKP